MPRNVFVSYSRKDKDFLITVNHYLENDFIVWTDEYIAGGDNWKDEIDKAIRSSFAVLVIVSSNSVVSPYVTYEWSLAIGMNIKVLPLVIESRVDMHPKLLDLNYFDCSVPARFPLIFADVKKRLFEYEEKYLYSERAYDITLQLLNEGRRENERNNLQNALDVLQEALNFANEKLKDDIYYEMALVYRKLGNAEAALKYLEQAHHSNPSHIHTLVELGSVYRKQADKTEEPGERRELLRKAEDKIRDAIKKQRDILDLEGESVWGSLGGLLKRQGHNQEAIEAYENATEVKKSSYPYNNLGLLYMAEGDEDLMKDNFSIVDIFVDAKIRIDPTDVWIHNDYLVAQLVLGKLERADDALRKVLLIAPDYALESLQSTLNDMLASNMFNDKIIDAINNSLSRVAKRIEVLKSRRKK